MNEQKILQVKKRTGELVHFDIKKISAAIYKAAQAVGGHDQKLAEQLAEQAVEMLQENDKIEIPTVEEIQDVVEKVLIEKGHAKTAKTYIIYRQKRAELREKAESFNGIKNLEEKQDPFGINEELLGNA